MQNNYWYKQIDRPLFPDLLWSRPEHISQAGKLAVIGGNVQGFAAAAEAFEAATKAGIGSCRVILPDSLQKTVGQIFDVGEYAPSTPSGSFSQQALDPILELGQWGDGMLIAGDLARNSETAILLEKVSANYAGRLTITKDAADYFTQLPGSLTKREDTLLVLSFAQLQKLAVKVRFPQAFTFDMDFLRLVEYLHTFTETYKTYIVVNHLKNIFVAVNGQVSTTRIDDELSTWRVRTAAQASVWWLQNPVKVFQALTTAVFTKPPTE